jgi:hypothetical protein
VACDHGRREPEETTLNDAKQAPPVKLPVQTKGKRPHFFDDPAIDQMMTFLIELTTEVAVLRERQDTVERLLDQHGSVTRAAIEAYRAPPEVEAERTAAREAYLKRVFRMHPAA